MLRRLRISAACALSGMILAVFAVVGGLLSVGDWAFAIAPISLVLGFLPFAVLQMPAFLRDRRKARTFYSADGHPLDDGLRVSLEPVDKVRILPLVELFSSDPELQTAAGVAYLVDFDGCRILFDLGLHPYEQPVSPLQHNLRTLGIDLSTIDAVVNSHPHGDHLGAWPDQEIMAKYDSGLEGKPFFALSELHVVPMDLQLVRKPQAIYSKLGTTGPLPCSLFLVNYTEEQALVIDLEDRGLIVIIGCGHPGIEAIVERAKQVFQRPVFAVLGGFHFPVTQDRCSDHWYFKPQMLIGGPHSFPWKPIGKKDVNKAIGFLLEKGITHVWLSAHDSCDWALNKFAEAFKSDVRIKVGEEVFFSKDMK